VGDGAEETVELPAASPTREVELREVMVIDGHAHRVCD
jgi:hypothetical protein